MKIHWSIADQEMQFGIEHTGKHIRLPKIHAPFIKVDYFMWGHEDVESITQRIQACGRSLRTLISGCITPACIKK